MVRLAATAVSPKCRGKRHLAYRGSADLSAAAGSRGVLLLDPKSIAITGGSGDSDGDGSDTQFSGVGLNSVVASILYSNSGPSVVYQSEIEAQSQTADITLQATRSISTSGTFDNGSLTLAPNSNLVIETRNAGSAETGLINLIASSHGPGLNIVTSGTGAISVRSGVGGDRSTPILLPNLISASDIHISAGGGPASSVLVFGTLSGANIAVDASGNGDCCRWRTPDRRRRRHHTQSRCVRHHASRWRAGRRHGEQHWHR